MARYIDANLIRYKDLPFSANDKVGVYVGTASKKEIDEIPTADVAEVKHGRWKVYSDKYPRYVCTNCNHLWNNKEFRYCPTCGAKMDG